MERGEGREGRGVGDGGWGWCVVLVRGVGVWCVVCGVWCGGGHRKTS